MSAMGGDPGRAAGMEAVVVTGAASGLGEALAREVVRSGGRVGLIDRRADALHALAEELGDGAVARVADVAQGEALTRAMDELDRELGALTAVVNNAGVGNLKRLVDHTDAEFDLLVRVNLNGVFNGIRAAVPLLRARGGGSIVNLASASGVRPTWGEGPYSAAKAAVIALTMTAALEEGPDIRVNCVSPGFVRTPLNAFLADQHATRRDLERGTPLGRIGQPEDVIGVIRFLCSPAAAYVTGQNLVVDGGSLLLNAQTHDVLRGLLDG
jgi:NAD(P)-dependent dehydrogenase (short-subunit alcohol dehydrogenase family)